MSASKKDVIIKNPYRTGAPWLDKLRPHEIGEPTKKRKPKVSPDKFARFVKVKTEPGTKEARGSVPSNAIDLTGADKKNALIILPLPVTPLCILKTQNPVFFGYNPNGYPKAKELPVGCCHCCRCPSVYCAELVFGEMCLKQAEYQVYTIHGMSRIHPSDIDELRIVFETIYTAAVKHKMMWNNIELCSEFHDNHIITVPGCIKRKSLRQFIKNYRYECKSDDDRVVSSPTLDVEEEGHETIPDRKGNNTRNYHKHFSM